MTILFADGFESGNFSRWDIVSPSGQWQKSVQTAIVHSGRFAAKLTISTSALLSRLGAPDSGVRLGFHNAGKVAYGDPDNLPREAYYSGWFYLPSVVNLSWLNLMQWKQGVLVRNREQTRVPVASHSAITIDGQMYLRLNCFVDESSQYMNTVDKLTAYDDVPLPIATWFELRAYYRWDKTANGQIVTWLNGRELWNVEGIRTELAAPFLSLPRQVTWNNYGNPKKYALYLDDCKVWTE